MRQKMVINDPTKLSPRCLRFLTLNCLDKILRDKTMSRDEILERVRFLHEEISVYG